MERYETYKDSGVEWIGEIPVGWNCVNLSALVKLRKNRNDGNGETNVLSLSYGCIKRRVLDNSGLLPESFETYNIIEAGDIVLRLTDLQNDQVSLRVGRCGERGIITSAYSTLEPVNALSKFLFYLLASFDYQKGFYGLAGGVRQSLTYDGIKSLKYPLPTWDEQQAIADFLDEKTAEIDDIVSETERSIELLREYRKSIISEAVTKGLDPDTPMKDSGVEWVGEIPEQWTVYPMQKFFNFTKGLAITKDNLVEVGEPVINYGQIHSKLNTGTRFHEELLRYISPMDEAIDKKSLTTIGDIVFADTSEDADGCGNCFYIDKEGIYGGYHTFIARPKKKEYGHFLAYLFQTDSWRSQIRSRVNGVKLFSVTQRVLNGNTVLLPSKPELKSICNYLETKTAEIDALIADKEKQVELLKEYRKSLISEAVTGKFKVPGVK